MTAPHLTGSVRRRARAAGPPAPRRPRFSRAAQPLPPPLPPPAAEPLEPRRLLATFVVTTTADEGPGSLRQAMLDANAAPGADNIHFTLPGAAGTVRTIRPLSALPDVTGPTTLDAATQAGYAGTPVVEIDGSAAGDDVDGLTLFESATTVRGLAVNGFGGNGIVTRPAAVPTTGATWVRVESSHVGTDAAGTAARPNGAAGVLALAPRTSLHLGNVISGNRGAGVVLRLPATTSTRPADMNVYDSRIGTDRTGSRALPNGREGVLVDGSAGGEDAYARVWISRNVLSGNASSGVRVDRVRGFGPRVYIAANKIGTDAAGGAAVANGSSPDAEFRDGVTVTGGSNVAIGQDNVISGNAGNGVAVLDSVVNLQMSTIGTDAAGARALGNGGHGVLVVRNSAVSSVYGNLVSGNGGDGVRVTSSERVDVLANRIGANAGWTAAVPNAGNGVTIESSRLVRVGAHPPFATPWPWIGPGPTPNRIVGNAGHGIAVVDDDTSLRRPPSGIVLRGNEVGIAVGSSAVTGPRTTVVIPNGGSGVYVAGAHGVTIGPGVDDPATNTIAHNVGDGVTVTHLAGVPALGVRINGNSIFNNGRLGIDLAPTDGVTPNDPRDADAGPNSLQNFPLITRVERDDLIVSVTLRLQSMPGRAYRLELFASNFPDRSGHGEGQRRLAAVDGVTTDSSGVATHTLSFRTPAFPTGEWLTATATDSAGSTSEFSPAVHSLRGRPFYRPRGVWVPPTRQPPQPSAVVERPQVLHRPATRATALMREGNPPLG